MKKFRVGLVLILIISMLFMACESTPSLGKAGTDLEACKGEWVSMGLYITRPELENSYKEIARQMPNYTIDGVKACAEVMWGCPVLKARFEDGKAILTVLDGEGKQVEKETEYVFKGKEADPDYPKYFWYKFEAAKDVPGLLNAKYFVLMPPHQHGENGMLHWHGRFGAKSAEDLIYHSDKAAWPTFAPASYTDEEMIGHLKNSIAFIKEMFPESPFEPYAKFSNGEWINSAAIYHNTSAEVEAAFAKVIKEFAGKNPKGGDFTKEDIIAEAEKAYGTTERYTHVKFNIENGVNELILLKNGKVVFKAPYKRVGETESKPGRLTVRAVSPTAGDMTYIAFTGAHGSPVHSHFWHAKTTDLSVCQGTPTCIPADTPDAEIAKRVESSARWVLKKLIGE